MSASLNAQSSLNENKHVRTITDRFEGIVNDDQLKLRQRISDNDEEAEKIRRHIYVDAVCIPVLLIIAIVFFLVATMDGKLFGTPDDELD